MEIVEKLQKTTQQVDTALAIIFELAADIMDEVATTRHLIRTSPAAPFDAFLYRPGQEPEPVNLAEIAKTTIKGVKK